MNNLLLHSRTRQTLTAFMSRPAHALLLVGPAGSGKRALAIALAENLLSLQNGKLSEYPYTLIVEPAEGRSIGIEAVRALQQFLALKVPSKVPSNQSVNRVIIIVDAHTMTIEAQNAVLKILEEPPKDTVLLLTVSHLQAVLPTIRSRAQNIQISPLDKTTLDAYFEAQGFTQSAINQSYAISGGLPGLMQAMLAHEDHPLLLATQKAREILAQTQYERLLAVDELSRQKQLALDVTFILQQMAHIRLQTAQGRVSEKWQCILEAAYNAAESLQGSAQPKLVLTKLLLTL